MSRWLIVIGLALVVAGLLWPWLGRIGLGRLPGDIVVERGELRLYPDHYIPDRQRGRVADPVVPWPLSRLSPTIGYLLG